VSEQTKNQIPQPNDGSAKLLFPGYTAECLKFLDDNIIYSCHMSEIEIKEYMLNSKTIPEAKFAEFMLTCVSRVVNAMSKPYKTLLFKTFFDDDAALTDYITSRVFKFIKYEVCIKLAVVVLPNDDEENSK
jgi:hypothetical protein